MVISSVKEICDESSYVSFSTIFILLVTIG
jgi:hypothetical protein